MTDVARSRGELSRLELLPATSNNMEIEAAWRELCSSNPHNFFLSWGWMQTWLETFADQANIQCLISYRHGKPQCGLFLGFRNYRKRGLLPTRSAHLNATGIVELDAITIEYNGILGTENCPSILNQLLESRELQRCDELVFSGSSAEFSTAVMNCAEPYYLNTNKQTSYYIELDKVREHGGDYLSLLSSNKRQQIRRSIREYEKGGAIRHEVASSLEEALQMFSDMGDLHSATWRKRGRQGCYANDHWVRFHRNLITNLFQAGEIHISRFQTDQATLGFVYGFIYQGRFLFCQCGFNYSENNKLRPGLVSHYLLIRYFCERGLAIYDFLAGDSDYKQSLATHRTTIYWLALQRRTAQFKLAKVFKNLVNGGSRLATSKSLTQHRQP